MICVAFSFLPSAMSSALYVTILFALFALVAGDRTFTINNNCPYTVWPAIIGSPTPNHATGWEAASGSSESFSVSEGFSGRIWGRTDCNSSLFDSPTHQSACDTGDCAGALACVASGDPPASLAEFTIGTNGSPDNYDVSFVDGWNIPVALDNTASSCTQVSCPEDLDSTCPQELQLLSPNGSTVVGCKSACEAGLAADSANSQNCCTGQYDTPQTCPSSNVQYYSFFHDACAHAYAYAYDDGNALFECSSDYSASYTVTFCPVANGTTTASSSAVPSAASSSAALTPLPPSSASPSSTSAPAGPATPSTVVGIGKQCALRMQH